ncbi:MAG: hypothetical protein J0M11_07980 [Anaerolineae bacterium]|nr:hypothetical protein [Anaerolineae bacterium]
MEILLAIVVASAVIFFGALISMGNERQRRAIDSLREQVVLWAVQDLRMKRASLTRSVNVPNPLDWFNRIASDFCGYDLNLQIIESYEEPQSIIFASSGGNNKIVCTPLSPVDIRKMRKNKHNRLNSIANQNPLISLPQHAINYECSVLNRGILFDVELSLAWKGLTGKNFNSSGFLWVYII